MTKELIEAGALRQFRHNDDSDGVVYAYDREIVDRVFAAGQAADVRTWQERCDWHSSEPAVWLMHRAMKEEIAELRAVLAQSRAQRTSNNDNSTAAIAAHAAQGKN